MSDTLRAVVLDAIRRRADWHVRHGTHLVPYPEIAEQTVKRLAEMPPRALADEYLATIQQHEARHAAV